MKPSPPQPKATPKPPLAEQKERLARYFVEEPDLFEQLMPPSVGVHSKFTKEVGTSKRVLEAWCGDHDFREMIKTDPDQALALYDISLEDAGIKDIDELRPLWDVEMAERLHKSGERLPDPVSRYRVWMAEKLLNREETIQSDCAPDSKSHRAWRARQMNRARAQLGTSRHEGIVHAPFVVELSDGCTVGCWFCGVSALNHEDDFQYTAENKELWRDVLQAMQERLGEAAATGFCYWATDPLDNPDYEHFMMDFKEICGHWPQTTTSQPQKDIERTRALLKLATAQDAGIQRFSILNRKILKTVMKNFTPEELLHTELVLQNKEANSIQSNSGKARGSKVLEKRASSQAPETVVGWSEAPGTISCVSGFLINMCTKSVRLVTPTPCDERWPKGHWICEEGFFTDGPSFRALIDGMTERHMKLTVAAGDLVRFRRDLRVEILENGFVGHSYGEKMTFENSPHGKAIAEALVAGNQTAGEIAIRLEDTGVRSAIEVFEFINELFDAGLLDEEPAEDPTREFDQERKGKKNIAKVSLSSSAAPDLETGENLAS